MWETPAPPPPRKKPTMRLMLTYCDHAANAFVMMNEARFSDLKSLEIAWNAIPTASVETDYLVDLDRGEGIEGNRCVTPEWIEQSTGRSVAEMLAEGRTINAERQAALSPR